MEEVYEAVKIDPVIQSSVDCVLELCLEASNYKIEYLNSVSNSRLVEVNISVLIRSTIEPLDCRHQRHLSRAKSHRSFPGRNL